MTPQEIRELAARLQSWGGEDVGVLEAISALTQAADRIERLEGALREIRAGVAAGGWVEREAQEALHPQTKEDRDEREVA